MPGEARQGSTHKQLSSSRAQAADRKGRGCTIKATIGVPYRAVIPIQQCDVEAVSTPFTSLSIITGATHEYFRKNHVRHLRFSRGGRAIGGTPGTAAGTATPSGSAPMSNVDVEAVLTKLAAENKEKLDWRKSIVDLMKLLKLDSSFGRAQGARQGARLHRRHERFGIDEHLAAQAGDAEARRERRQGPRRSQVTERRSKHR